MLCCGVVVGGAVFWWVLGLEVLHCSWVLLCGSVVWKVLCCSGVDCGYGGVGLCFDVVHVVVVCGLGGNVCN